MSRHEFSKVQMPWKCTIGVGCLTFHQNESESCSHIYSPVIMYHVLIQVVSGSMLSADAKR